MAHVKISSLLSEDIGAGSCKLHEAFEKNQHDRAAGSEALTDPAVSLHDAAAAAESFREQAPSSPSSGQSTEWALRGPCFMSKHSNQSRSKITSQTAA